MSIIERVKYRPGWRRPYFPYLFPRARQRTDSTAGRLRTRKYSGMITNSEVNSRAIRPKRYVPPLPPPTQPRNPYRSATEAKPERRNLTDVRYAVMTSAWKTGERARVNDELIIESGEWRGGGIVRRPPRRRLARLQNRKK